MSGEKGIKMPHMLTFTLTGWGEMKAFQYVPVYITDVYITDILFRSLQPLFPNITVPIPLSPFVAATYENERDRKSDHGFLSH